MVCSQTSQFAWPQLDISSWSYQSTLPQTDISPCSNQPSQVPCNTLDFTLLGFLTASGYFFLAYVRSYSKHIKLNLSTSFLKIFGGFALAC